MLDFSVMDGWMSDQLEQLSLVAVGGVGGSGTRLIAEFLKILGYYIGEDLNNANDNLWFTLLFKRLEILSASDEEISNLIEVFLVGMASSPATFSDQQIQLVRSLSTKSRLQHSTSWLQERADSFLANRSLPKPPSKLAWKEPNTHIVIHRLQKKLPKLKYIHVMRHGLDMAYSANQNQLKLWGEAYLGRKCDLVTPFDSLQYWVAVHSQILEINDNKRLLLNFDELCCFPSKGISTILDFLDIEAESSMVAKLEALVVMPKSLGRHKAYPLDVFDSSDLDVIKRLGFQV